MVPTFTTQPIGQGGAPLYSGSIATPTPQAFNVASPPEQETSFGVEPPVREQAGHALHTGPYPPDLSRLNAYGASTTGSLSLHLLTSLDGPAPSGSPGTSRRCRGRLPPSPAFPGSGCPQLHRTAATARRRRSSTSTRLHSASWRTPVSPKVGQSHRTLTARLFVSSNFDRRRSKAGGPQGQAGATWSADALSLRFPSSRSYGSL